MPAAAPPATPFVLDCRGRRLDARPGRAHVMGILNVTPDSFSDGGRYQDPSDALRRAEAMLKEGAALIDVGGESTRPRGKTYGAGAEAVAADEERRRVVPVVRGLAERFPEALISIDTYKPQTARVALEAGAHLVNDVTGLRLFPEMAEVCAEAGAPLVVMHALGRPGEMPHEHHYNDVVEDVIASLRGSVERAEAAGVQDVVVDPGFGFGKTTAENLRLVAETDRLLEALGQPVLIGLSRKSSIGRALRPEGEPTPVGERLFGSLGATAVAVLRGASLVRTHDVRATVETLRLVTAVEGERRSVGA